MRIDEVLQYIPESRSGWYEGIKTGIYPKPVKANPLGRNVGWLADEIFALQSAAVAARDADRAA